MSVLLEEEYGATDVKSDKIERLKRVLVKEVVYEIEAFLDDDVDTRLAQVLGLTIARGIDLVAEREHIETTNAALRNDLLQKTGGKPGVAVHSKIPPGADSN